jgi:hypothetical protein
MTETKYFNNYRIVSFVLVLLNFTGCIISKNDTSYYSDSFLYKNYDDTSCYLPQPNSLYTSYAKLSPSIFNNTDILRVINIYSPVHDSIFHFLCNQNVVNLWEKYCLLSEHYPFIKDAYDFNSRENFIKKREEKIRIYYLGRLWFEDQDNNQEYEGYVFLIDESFLEEDRMNLSFLNRKLMLLNCQNTRISSITIMSKVSADGYWSNEYYSIHNASKNTYHFKGEYFDDDVLYLKKCDALRAERQNTDLGVKFSFDKNGYVRVFKKY